MVVTPLKTRIMFLCVIALAIALRLISLDKCFQGDEYLSLMNASVFRDIPYAIIDDSHPPLYFYLLHFWMKISCSEAWLRVLSIIPGIGLCILAYALAKEAGGYVNGIVASLLVAVSPLAVWSSQYVRTYAMGSFFIVLAVFFLVRLIKMKRYDLPGWAPFILASATAVYTFYFTALLIIAENIFVFIFMRDDKKFIKAWVIAQALIGALYLPWLPYFLYQRSCYIGLPQMVEKVGFYIGPFHAGGLVRSAMGLVGIDPRYLAKGAMSGSAVFKYGAVVAVGIAFVVAANVAFRYLKSLKASGEDAKCAILFLTLSLVPFVIALILHQAFKIILMSQYFIASFVFTVLFLVTAFGKALSRALRASVLVLVLGFFALRLACLYQDREMDFASAHRYVKAVLSEGTAVVAPSFGGIFDHYFSDVDGRYHLEDPHAFKVKADVIIFITHPSKLELMKLNERFGEFLMKGNYTLIGSRRCGDLEVRRYRRS